MTVLLFYGPMVAGFLVGWVLCSLVVAGREPRDERRVEKCPYCYQDLP